MSFSSPPRRAALPGLASRLLPLGLVTGGLLLGPVASTRAADASYVGVLRQLSDGDRQASLAALERYETAAVDPEKPSPTLQKLAAGELGVLRRVARRSGAEAILPAIALHLDSYLYYLERDSRFLMSHSRTITSAALDLYLETSDSADAAPIVGWLRTKLAGSVLQTRSRGAAQELLESVLAIDGGNARARLGLAAIREKEGRYQEVVDLLADSRPRPIDRGEIWLRLAVNLARVGELNEAAGLFESLFEDADTPSWVRSLAYQELANMLFRVEQWDSARELLEKATEALPEDEPLHLQLAYAYERMGAPRAAQSAAERVETPSEGERAAELRPRDRYNRYPKLEAAPEEEVQFDEWLVEWSQALADGLTEIRGS